MSHRAIGAAGAGLLLMVGLAPGCISGFGNDSPYTCNPGFASCMGMGMGSNPGCETSITSDPQNCGSCGTGCSFGAACADGQCLTPPRVLTTDANPAMLAVNASDIYYWSVSGNNALMGLPKAGGSPFPIALGSASVQNNTTMGTPFAVDDARVYFSAANNTGMGSTTYSLDAVPADGTSGTVTIAPFPSSTQGNLGLVDGVLLSGNTLCALTNNGGSGLEIWSAPKMGGAVTMVSTLVNGNGIPDRNAIAIDMTDLYVVDDAGGCTIARVPLGGGSASMLPTSAGNGGNCPQTIATDGTNLYWSTSGSMGNQACTSSVFSEPIAGGTATSVAQLPSSETAFAMAVDGASLYVVTNESVWRMPTAGGTPTRIAGSLGGGTGACGGGSSSFNVSLAIDATNVYVALTAFNPQGGSGNYILAIAK